MKDFLSRLFSPGLEIRAPGKLGIKEWLTFAAIMLLAIAARFLKLDEIPPGLWYDEALYALDGYKVSQGHWAIFFDEHGHPREPLFPWSLGLAFWLAEPTVLVARCVSAVWGTLAVALFFPVARRFFPEKWALAATAAFAVFRWHVHFSRTIFRAGLASPLMLLAVWLFLRWRERKRSVDAALCGAAIGACLYTYISLRIVPALVTLWIVWLAWRGSLSLRREWKQIALLYGTALLVFLPMGIDYLRHPEHLTGRTGEISMFEKTVTRQAPEGEQEVRVPKTAGEAAAGLAENAWLVAKTWFIRGDHVAKHNIPYRPVFDPVTGLLFFFGLCICFWALIRTWSFAGLMLLTWFGGFAAASVFSFGAPNILRMQGASPAVILLMMLGLYRLVHAWPAGCADFARRAVAPLVLVFFGALQMWDYFGTFPNDVRVRREFTADVFYEPARAVDAIAPEVDKVYVPEEMAQNLQFRFATIRRDNILSYSPGDVLQLPQGESAAWLLTLRSMQLAAEAGNPQEEQLRAVPGVRAMEFITMPIDEKGRLIGFQPWAELWVAR